MQLPDGTLCALPSWMTDASACATMTLGPARASCDELPASLLPKLSAADRTEAAVNAMRRGYI